MCYLLFSLSFIKFYPLACYFFETEITEEHESGSSFIYVQEGSSTSITCKTIKSLPAVELSLTLLGDTSSTLGNSNLSKYPNALDGALFDTESTITIHPERKHHGMFIQCYVSLDGDFIHVLLAKLIVYGEFGFSIYRHLIFLLISLVRKSIDVMDLIHFKALSLLRT